MKKLAKIREQINQKITTSVPVINKFMVMDTSVKAEVRLQCDWSITYPVDEIHFPKPIDNPWPQPEPWIAMRGIVATISIVAKLAEDHRHLKIAINERTKTGPARRAEAKTAFEIEHGQAFLAAYRRVTTTSAIRKISNQITQLQVEQKALLPLMRAHNSSIMLARRTASSERQAANREALASGRFWDADRDALKDYFHPPFNRNYLADVSEKWHAALYTEMQSTAWKAGKGDWRHKNVGTGRGYLCGIDDNGDEWGHHVDLQGYLDLDNYGDYGYVGTVEDAMSALFDIPKAQLEHCERQGDLLFCREQIPEGVQLHAQAEAWEIRESHRAASDTLLRNGQYIRSETPIRVTHTSHGAVILSPGDYRLYLLQVSDAD